MPDRLEPLRPLHAQEGGLTVFCISLTQPWASLVALGIKHFETRSWSTSYRGPLAIHAARQIPADVRGLCRMGGELYAYVEKPLRLALWGEGIISPLPDPVKDLPLGAFVAVVDLVDVVPTESFRNGGLTTLELFLGDYSPGRFAWKLERVRRLDPPIPYRGQQGLWPIKDARDPVRSRLEAVWHSERR